MVQARISMIISPVCILFLFLGEIILQTERLIWIFFAKRHVFCVTAVIERYRRRIGDPFATIQKRPSAIAAEAFPLGNQSRIRAYDARHFAVPKSPLVEAL